MQATLLAAVLMALAQASPAFEAITVKRNASGADLVRLRTPPDGGIAATNITLRELVRTAYQIQDYQLVGGPNWLARDRFDIVATGNGEASEERVLAKLRALLAERFDLQIRRETRDMPIYALVPSRPGGGFGPQLHRSSADCGTGAGCGIDGSRGSLTFTGQPMSRVAEMLSRRADRQVVDRTNLTGAFDATLKWTPDTGTAPAADTGPSLFTAVLEQLGLRLEPQRGPVTIVVIEGATPPAEN